MAIATESGGSNTSVNAKKTVADIVAEVEAKKKPTAANTKATKIAATEDATTTAYQASLTAPAPTKAYSAALSDIASQTAAAILTGSPLPAAARTGVSAAPSATATWTGTGWDDSAAQNAAQNRTTARATFEAMARAAGIPADMIPASVNFFEQLDKNGVDESKFVDMFMDTASFTGKDGTVVESPFYKRFTAITAGKVNPSTGLLYTGKDAFAWRLGIEQKVNDYGISPEYKTDDVLKRLANSGVSVDKFEQRIQTANAAATAADPARVNALIAMGYIKNATQLKDFYLNPDIGQRQLEENQRIGAFATEAIRAKDLGVKFDTERIKQVAANYGSVDAATAEQQANALYQTVGSRLNQTIALSDIYSPTAQTEDQRRTTIQTELENEILTGMPSQRRKRVSESNIRAFEAQSGTQITSGGLASQTGSKTISGLL